MINLILIFVLFLFFSNPIRSQNDTGSTTTTTATTSTMTSRPLTAKLPDNTYVSEFEITEMSNHDGRLQNGFCCNGARPGSNGFAGCKGGNTTCLPFWRICIAELAPDMTVPMMNREASNYSMVATTKKPWIFQNLFSKIFGSSSGPADRRSDQRNNQRYLKELVERQSPSSCQIGFWSSSVILPDTEFPIRLRKLVTFKSPKSSSIISHRNFVSIVEIWSKNIRNDVKNRLIARQVNYYNVYADVDTVLSDEWFYGGKVSIIGGPSMSMSNELGPKKRIATSSTTGDLLSHLGKRFRFRYRWHLRRLDQELPMEELAMLNATAEGCPQGYRGPDCNIPICLEGCDPDHGYCDQPGQCTCRFGWTGMHCNYCLTLPGCVHGTCSRPLECRCEEGWTGVFCSNPKCRDGCHHQNGYCNNPDECKCRFGWKGENCTQCSELPGCQHGTCQEPLDCICKPGWQGTFCSTPICSPGCDRGWCQKPGECRCNIGFSGDNCTECVPYPGCQNGHCQDNRPWTCQCDQGYGGFLCDEQLDWCERNKNPCQNQGECISIEQEEGGYRCRCPRGFTGRDCDQIEE